MSENTYVIDAAHGEDDVAVCDWNTCIQSGNLEYGHDPDRNELKFVAPTTQADFGLDSTTTRAGLLFRGVAAPGAGEIVARATLRLYLTDWDPNGYVDPYYGIAGQNPYPLHVHGCKRFPPAPGYVEHPGASAPGWGALPATAIAVRGTGVQVDGFAEGSNPPAGWPANYRPGWSEATRCWYPTRFDCLGRADYGSGPNTVEIGLRTTARTVVNVARGPAGYVDVDVTAQVREIIAFDHSVPAWAARTYYVDEPTPGTPSMPDEFGFGFRQIPLVISGGYVYAMVGSGVPVGAPGGDNEFYWPRGRSAVSTTAPSGTTIGAEEQPDGAGTAIWRCVRQGQPPNWQDGDNLAFVILVRPAGWTVYRFSEAIVVGWRTFASGDLGDAGKYPTLVVETGPEGAVALPVTLSLTADAVTNNTQASASLATTLAVTADAAAHHVAEQELDAVVMGLASGAVQDEVGEAVHALTLGDARDGDIDIPTVPGDALAAATLGFGADAVVGEAGVWVRRNLRVGADWLAGPHAAVVIRARIVRLAAELAAQPQLGASVAEHSYQASVSTRFDRRT